MAEVALKLHGLGVADGVHAVGVAQHHLEVTADQGQVLQVAALLGDEQQGVQVDLVYVGQLKPGDLVSAVLDQPEEMVTVEVRADETDLTQGVEPSQEVEAVGRLQNRRRRQRRRGICT